MIRIRPYHMRKDFLTITITIYSYYVLTRNYLDSKSELRQRLIEHWSTSSKLKELEFVEIGIHLHVHFRKLQTTCEL